MALYVIPVPAPAVGHDWTYTIPGQYVEDIVAVTATLLTGGTGTVILDESGNGRNATATTQDLYTIGNVGPWSGGADNYAVFHPDATGGNNPFAQVTANLAFDGGAFSAEQWCYVNKPGVAITSGLFAWFNSTSTAAFLSVNVRSNLADPYDMFIGRNGGVAYTLTGVATRGVWHHIALTYGGGTSSLYVDGVLKDARAQGVTQPQAVGPTLGSSNDFGVSRGYCAGPAFFGSTLSGAQVAAHYAARGSWAAYKAATIADGAAGLWNIGKPATGPARNVALQVTNGTSVIGRYPPATVPVNGQTGYTYSWQSALGSGTQTGGGTTIAVPIPDLVLPAGYTIGTTTSDLAATDRWSNINVWWDDEYQQNTVNLGTYEYAPGALLRWRPYSPGI